MRGRCLGGEMAKNIDKTWHPNVLNTGKGPAVRALLAQADKELTQKKCGKRVVQENLTFAKP